MHDVIAKSNLAFDIARTTVANHIYDDTRLIKTLSLSLPRCFRWLRGQQANWLAGPQKCHHYISKKLKMKRPLGASGS
jgi:hypothetical protein